MTPIRVLDDCKLFYLPVSIAVLKFIKACLHNIYKVRGGLWGLLCPQSRVKLDTVKFVLCLLCSRHEWFDLWFWNWDTILVGEKTKPWRGWPKMIMLSICILVPILLVPMVNSWVIQLIQWWGLIKDFEAVGFLLVGSHISH